MNTKRKLEAHTYRVTSIQPITNTKDKIKPTEVGIYSKCIGSYYGVFYTSNYKTTHDIDQTKTNEKPYKYQKQKNDVKFYFLLQI